MRFKAFLQESSSVSSAYKPISEEQLYTLAHTQFSEAFGERYPYIIRGMNKKDDHNIFLVSGIKGRVSANTSNDYTVLTDAHPGWQKYPKRSESLICTTANNIEYAQDFGEVFMILPENGAKIGLCSGFDFWESFPIFTKHLRKSFSDRYISGVNIFNDTLRGLMHAADIKLPEHNTSYVKLVGALNQISDYIQNKNSPHVSAEEKKFFATVLSGEESMLEFCNRILDPETNGFKLVSYKELKPYSTKNHEVWLSAPSLAIISPEHDYPELSEIYDYFNEIKNNI